MMAGTSEDSKANLIINNVLGYTSTARHSMRYGDIVRSCLVFYKEDDIIRGKDMLCEIVGEKSKRRRNENRIMHEVQDILNLFKKCDNDGFNLPTFVADGYDSMPPTSGFEVVAHSMQTLIEEISKLKKEIECLRENRLTDDMCHQNNMVMQEDLLIIKGELRKLNLKLVGDDVRSNSLMLDSLDETFKHIGGKRKTSDLHVCTAVGNDHISSDIGCNESRLTSQEDNAESTSVSPNAPPSSQEEWHILNNLLHDAGGPPSAPTYASIVESVPQRKNCDKSMALESSLLPCNDDKEVNRGHLSTEKCHEADDITSGNMVRSKDDFIIVQNRKNRKNIIGSKKTVVSGSIKSAVRLGDLYVGNCDQEVTCESLVKYIYDEMKIKVEKCEQLVTRNASSISFKVTLHMNDRMKLLSPDAWPEGIICRKFYNPRRKSNG